MKMRSAFLWTMIGSLTLAAALGVLAILFDTFGSTSEKILVTSLLMGAYSMTALGSAIVLDRHRRKIISWLGISMSIAALLHWSFMIWFEPWTWNGGYRLQELLMKIGATFTIIAIWCPHLGLLSLLRLDRGAFRGVRTVTHVITGLLAAVVMIVFWTEEFGEWTGKMIAVLAMLGSCGTLVTPILGIVERAGRKDSAESIQRRVKIDLTCPRCGLAQIMKTGSAKCTGCGLRISIDVEEPRCTCGYLLFQLTGDACPECGKPIEPEDRWRLPVGSPPEPEVDHHDQTV